MLSRTRIRATILIRVNSVKSEVPTILPIPLLLAWDVRRTTRAIRFACPVTLPLSLCRKKPSGSDSSERHLRTIKETRCSRDMLLTLSTMVARSIPTRNNSWGRMPMISGTKPVPLLGSCISLMRSKRKAAIRYSSISGRKIPGFGRSSD